MKDVEEHDALGLRQAVVERVVDNKLRRGPILDVANYQVSFGVRIIGDMLPAREKSYLIGFQIS